MLIHKMRLDEYMAVLDVNSGAVHLVDDVIYDLLEFLMELMMMKPLRPYKQAIRKKICVKL